MSNVRKEFWNNQYWNKHLADNGEKGHDFLDDFWLDKYKSIIDKIPKGRVLDLGCGLGQYTKYFMDLGFEVVSADISLDVLKRLKKDIPNATVIELDMSEPLPFEDGSFDVVFSNLAIHYFDADTTSKLLGEIRRIQKETGKFIGSVNSSKIRELIKGEVIEIEPGYYLENGRYARLFDEQGFDLFSPCFSFEVLDEVTTTRWGRTKIMWEFIATPREKQIGQKSGNSDNLQLKK